jgi:hypothetical protein
MGSYSRCREHAVYKENSAHVKAINFTNINDMLARDPPVRGRGAGEQGDG